jgi:hypothetical protein
MRKHKAKNARGAEAAILAHPLTQALFLLRLDLKALTARADNDDTIAHPGGLSIIRTAFHDDALIVIRQSSVPLVQKCLAQLVECHKLLPVDARSSEINSAFRAIRNYLELIAGRLRVPFTNDDRLIVSILSSEACDLCALAIHFFAINNMRENDTPKCTCHTANAVA